MGKTAIFVEERDTGRFAPWWRGTLFVFAAALTAACCAVSGCGGRVSADVATAAQGQSGPAPVFWDGSADVSWYDEGKDEFVINTAAELAGIANLVSEGAANFKGKVIKLGRDITVSDTANWRTGARNAPGRNKWMPIGTVTTWFHGTFDGGGHTVSGIYVNAPNITGVGLFGVISQNAVIKNTGITASYIRGRNTAGGLVGYNAGLVINSYSAAYVDGRGSGVGGLVGYNHGGTVAGCYASGSVSGKENVGGLAGSSADSALIINSYSAGTVKGTAAGATGGLVGFNAKSVIKACYSTTTVTLRGASENEPDWSDNNWKRDGLVGENENGKVIASFFDTKEPVSRGINWRYGRTTDKMMQKSTYTRWDFDRVWGIDSAVNKGYPYLLGKSGESVLGKTGPATENPAWYKAGANEFTISTAEELAEFAQIVNGSWGGVPSRDDFYGKTVRLAKNIDLSAYKNWVAIGGVGSEFNRDDLSDSDKDDAAPPFSGTFDGGGFVISNLTINRPGVPFQGLFGSIKNATVKNVGLEGVNIHGGWLVGAVVGSMGVNSRVVNCYSSGAVSGSNNAGGLVGYASGNCFITDSYSSASVTTDGPVGDGHSSTAGGVAGSVSHYSMVIGSYSTGTVTSTGDAGGVAGEGRSSLVRGSAALNPKLESALSNTSRIISGGQTVNNVAYDQMKSSTELEEYSLEYTGLDKDDGADISAAEIHADPTLGGRFTKDGGWTTEKGKLPGLFGKAAEMPKHLAQTGTASAKPAPKKDKKDYPHAPAAPDYSKAGGRLKKLISDLPEGASLAGGRSRASVQRVIMLEHMKAIRLLYGWLQDDDDDDASELRGTIAVRFKIGASGRVTSARLEKSTVNHRQLENAVVLRVEHMHFGPAGKPGDVTEVVYPFVFGSQPAKAETSSARAMPATLEECYAALDKQLSEETKDEIALSNRGNFLSGAHFGLGMWIRNNWIYPNEKLRTHFGGRDPDSISSIILSGYYTYLTGNAGTDYDDDD